MSAEKEYLEAQTKEQKIKALKKMISHAPSHKGAENLRAQLKRRLARLKYANEQEIKKTKSTKSGIKKEDMQAVIIGKTGIGKSRLLTLLTNATPKIAETPFEKYTTTKPEIGMMNYQGCQIQLIENPAIESEYYDKGLSNSADTLIILFTDFAQLERIEKEIQNTRGKRIIAFISNLNKFPEQIRKIKSRLESKKYNFVIIDLNTKENLEELKEKISKGSIEIDKATKIASQIAEPCISKKNVWSKSDSASNILIFAAIFGENAIIICPIQHFKVTLKRIIPQIKFISISPIL